MSNLALLYLVILVVGLLVEYIDDKLPQKSE